jgi:hypothetical protein
MAYIYRHIRLDKNEPCYIGIAKEDNGIYRRANEIKLGRNLIHQSIINKTTIIVEIVLDGLTWEEACEKEKELIMLYGRKDQGTGILSNMTDGGEGAINRIYSEQANLSRSVKLKGRKFSEETINKMKASRNARTDSQKGYKRSEETKLKNSLSHKGKCHSEETKQRMSNSHKGQIAWNKGMTYKLTSN